MVSIPKDVSELLKAWSDDDQEAQNQLMQLVYDELRRLARNYLRRERADHTLQPTALVHEAYLRLIDQQDVNWQNRAHFFGVSAQLMRRVLVDFARRRPRLKDGNPINVSLDEAFLVGNSQSGVILALDDALTALAELDPRKSQIVEMRFFGGLSVEETAEVLHISAITVMREWNKAKAWLYRELSRGSADED